MFVTEVITAFIFCPTKTGIKREKGMETKREEKGGFWSLPFGRYKGESRK